MEVQAGRAVGPFSAYGNMMDDLTNLAELIGGSQKTPVIVIMEDEVLARTCAVNILKRELVGFEIAEMITTGDLNWLSGRDVRLIAFNIGDKQISAPSIEERLQLIEEACPNAYVALLSNRDDEATAAAAMQRGIRGFFPTSIGVEVAIAGLRLVLAGGVYRPLPIVKPNDATSLRTRSECELSVVCAGSGASHLMPEQTMAGLTPREQHVLAALKLGLPNKLIAVRLNLSENTVKMHIQHIMRKCRARNRTEAVLRWSGRSNGNAPSGRVPS
jgi:DNA-binding NarL/FixJ family response regulator